MCRYPGEVIVIFVYISNMRNEDAYYFEGNFGDNESNDYRLKAIKFNMEDIDEVMMSVGYNNTRKILFGVVSYEELLERAIKENMVLFLGHDPDVGITDEIIEDMLSYYEYTEEYEICVEIRDFLLKRDGGSLDK